MIMSEVKKEGEELTVWGAVGPNGHVVKSSIGIFKAVANRWALRRGNYEVVKLGTIRAPAMEGAAEAEEAEAAPKPKRHREVRGPQPRGPRAKRGRPRKEEAAHDQKAG